MDHAYLSIRNAKSLSVDKTLDGGHLIQEEDYDIDLNVNTIDGKNSFYSMA